MKFFAIISLFCFAFSLSAQHKKKHSAVPPASSIITQTSTKASPIKLTPCFYKRIEGSVGKQKVIEMDLIRIDSVIEGTFYYKNNVNPLEFIGTINDAGNIIVNELGKYDIVKAKYPITATFQGVFITESLIKGTLTKVRNDSVYPFEFKEVYQAGSGQFDLIRKEKTYGNCHDDKMCASFTLIYPQMKKSPHQDKINKQILNALLTHYTERQSSKMLSLDALIDDFISRYKEEEKNFANNDSKTRPSWNHYNEVLVVFNAHNIVSLQFKAYISESGAKPYEMIEYENFDMTNGQILKLDNLFIKDYKARLTVIAEDVLRRYYGFAPNQPMKGFTFKNGVFELNDNFTVNKKGIMFRYNPYEIGSYSMGSPQVFIPFEQIKHLVNWSGVLGDLMKE